MKKGLKIILIIISIWIVMFLTDFICVKTINKPIFMVKTNTYKDGGSAEYIGVLYKVIICNTLSNDKSIKFGTYGIKYSCNNSSNDALTFSKEYDITIDNVYVYKSINEIINILKHGSGVVYLGFPECPWCKAYVPMLNDVAKSVGVEKIYYLNILESRKNNTEGYREIVNLLSEYLEYDEEGNKRVYVPAVIALKNGKIVGFDDETSLDTKGFKDPSEYWTDEDVTRLKDKLSIMLAKTLNPTCPSCNKD